MRTKKLILKHPEYKHYKLRWRKQVLRIKILDNLEEQTGRMTHCA